MRGPEQPPAGLSWGQGRQPGVVGRASRFDPKLRQVALDGGNISCLAGSRKSTEAAPSPGAIPHGLIEQGSRRRIAAILCKGMSASRAAAPTKP